ncbi:MAG: tetratricopeptide repeat protein [Patescibacteria group bacterium]
MFLTVLLIIIFGIAVIALVWLFSKKWKQLTIMDPLTDPESQSKTLKYQILRKRVERAGEKHVKKMQIGMIEPVGRGLQSIVRRIAGKLTAVERQYQNKKISEGDVAFDPETLKLYIEDGKKLMEEEAWDRAEKKFIEVISHDAKNVDAYEYLGRLYLYKKDYGLAKETFMFLKRLSPEDPSVLAAIGEVEERLGNHESAHEHFKEALNLSPKNPKYLDFYIETCIEEKNLHEAQSVLDRLIEANPDNNKIENFNKQIAELRETMLGSGSTDKKTGSVESSPAKKDEKKKK